MVNNTSSIQSIPTKHKSTNNKQHENQQHTLQTVSENEGPLRGRVPLAAICTSR